MKKSITFVFTVILSMFLTMSYGQNAIALSQDMLASIKMNQPIEDYEKALADISFDSLVQELDTDAEKQTFWLNIYISYSQKAMASGEPCDKSCKKAKNITIAQNQYSLNYILYSVLLHSKCSITGGKKLHASSSEKLLRVGFPDGRVLLAITGDEEINNHVTYFEVPDVDQQLNETAKMYVHKYLFYKESTNELYLPKWIKHFKREFGNTSGIYGGLKKANFIPEDSEPKIIYTNNIASFK